jgi:hypothetical protein
LGGGAADVANPLRPGGFAAGYGSTYNLTGSSTTTGVQLGTLGGNDQGSRLFSAGGAISIPVSTINAVYSLTSPSIKESVLSLTTTLSDILDFPFFLFVNQKLVKHFTWNIIVEFLFCKRREYRQ